MSTGPDPKFHVGDRVRRTRHASWAGTVRAIDYEPAGMTLHGPIGASWIATVEWDAPNEERCKNWSVRLLEKTP